MTDTETVAMALGYLEGFSATVWAFVGEKLADECAARYDECVEILRKAVFEIEGEQ